MNQERFYKLGEVQTMLEVSRSTLWRWQAEHGLKVVRVGACVRVRQSDLEAFLKRHETLSGFCKDLPQQPTAETQSP